MMGTRISKARQAIPMSQEEFATALGVTTRAVQLWESGEREPRARSIRAMAILTERPTDWFLDDKEKVA